MKRVTAQWDASQLLGDRPIKIAMADGLHVRVVQRISLHEAHELIAELEAALACAIEQHATPIHYPRSPGGSE